MPGFAFSDVVERPGTDPKTREMLTVAAFDGHGHGPGSS